MGKDNLLLGTARGKLGDVVFYRTDGEQRFRTRVRPTNRRTNAQLLQRVVVATAVKAYSNFVEVCNHAFQNFEGAMKNQQRYMRLNIKMLREIALQNIESWSPIRFNDKNFGNWLPKDATVTVVNPYIVSEGDLPSVEKKFIDAGTGTGAAFLHVDMDIRELTYETFIEAIGLNAGDQLTFIMQRCLTNAVVIQNQIARIILMPRTKNLGYNMFQQDGQKERFVITEANAENYGEIYFGFKKDAEGDGGYIFVYPQGWNSSQVNAFGVIVSRYENNMWRRSTEQMLVGEIDQNVASLQGAMSSYLMAETSSLYLNQAQRVDQLGNPITYSEEARINEELLMREAKMSEETEEKTSRKSKK